MQIKVNDITLCLEKGDLTESSAEAIVNAANEKLAHGGGVAAAIARKGGPSIQQQSDRWVQEHGRVGTGSVAITQAGRLKAKWVIHAVGPVMGSGEEDEKLASATRQALALAAEKGIRSIAFPAISTGIFGFPVDRCASVMLSTIRKFAAGHTLPETIAIWLYDDQSYARFEQAAKNLL